MTPVVHLVHRDCLENERSSREGMASKESTGPRCHTSRWNQWRFGYWTKAIFGMVETRLVTVMVLQPYVGRAGIEFGAAQCVDATESAAELCGPMLVFQDAIPDIRREVSGDSSDQQQERRSRKRQLCRWL
jgi:hypothetical protein